MKETLKEKVERTIQWMELADKLLKGKVIERATWEYWYADPDDREEWGVHSTGLVLHLKDVKTEKISYCYVSQDDEQNGPGALVLQYEKGNGKQKHMEQKTLPINVEAIEEHQFNVEQLINSEK